MKRVYADTSDFRAPFDSPNLSLSGSPDGLGGDPRYAPAPGYPKGQVVTQWPRGRRYYDTSNFRAPYDDGYYQDNTLFGLGADPAQVPGGQPLTAEQRAVIERQAPPGMRRLLVSGEPMGTLGRNVASASAQVPWWLWTLGAAASAYGSYAFYRRWQKR